MENGNLELGDVHMVEESAQRLLHRVTNEASHTDRSSPSIFMVPSVLRDLSPSSFNPRVVSIGPLHREDVNVQAFEGQKSSYVIKLMSRFNYSREEIIKSCMQKAYSSMSRIKTCYVWTKTYSDAEIAEMMVMDACFILEFLLEACILLYPAKVLQFQSLMHDLVLLENQIPLFFLNEIYQCTISKFASDINLIKLIHRVLSWHNLFEADLKIENVSISTAHHILSLLHQCYKPPPTIKENAIRSRVHSAVDLQRAGVNFKPSKDPIWVMEMEIEQYRFPYFFRSWSKPTLTMPAIIVQDSTEFVLRNLIAYEESFPTQSYVTSYATAMDMLVNTQEDVAKLIDSRVLINIMGSNKEAANMINNICKHVTTDRSFYKEKWEKLNEYCNGYWPKHITRMRSTYFNSPWSVIALLAGIILFVLQVVQTIFSIKYPENNM